MQIHVRNCLVSGYPLNVTLHVDSSDTIGSVATQLERRLGVPPILQRFIFQRHSLHHAAPGTLADHKIVNDSHLTVLYSVGSWIALQFKMLKAMGIDIERGKDAAVAGKMRITVIDYMVPDRTGETIKLDAEASDTIARVKEQVQRVRGYPTAMQTLEYCKRSCNDYGKTVYLSTVRRKENGETLEDYDVDESLVLVLSMDQNFAIAADREERRKLEKAEGKEIADHVEATMQHQQTGDDKTTVQLG